MRVKNKYSHLFYKEERERKLAKAVLVPVLVPVSYLPGTGKVTGLPVGLVSSRPLCRESNGENKHRATGISYDVKYDTGVSYPIKPYCDLS